MQGINMTRKCVLCKETNYRNTYSFFSAPKDPEMRKKWQNAIAIENYAVTDDTYVCSKHFHKDDIITHWVSGVPPHVITIKYKKCRLRPGAVPGKYYHLEHNRQTGKHEHSHDSDVNVSDYLTFKSGKESSGEKKKNFGIPRSDENSYRKYKENHTAVTLDYEYSEDYEDYDYILRQKNLSDNVELPISESDVKALSQKEPKVKESSERIFKQIDKESYLKSPSNSDKDLIKNVKTESTNDEQSHTRKGNSYSSISEKTSQSSTKSFNTSDGDDTSREIWEHKEITRKNTSLKEISVDNSSKVVKNICIKEEVLDASDYDHLDTYYHNYNDTEESEMLFEDLLEVCTEVILPRGWSCLVTSKGRTTTIVYLFMAMTKDGMPFVEKQVFVKSDMILRCTIVNKEIDPLIHNLIREGKHLRVQSLLDIEELIDELDQRVVCQGVYNNAKGSQEMNGIKLAYKDGIKWRHNLCSLIINNDSPRCTKCIALSYMLTHKSKTFLSFRCNPPLFAKRQERIYFLQQAQKRTRKHDRRYEFIKKLKK